MAAQLRLPDAPERFSALAGAPVLVVDARDADALSPDDAEALRRGLRALPCVTLALVAADEECAAAGCARHFDLAVASEEACARAAACARRSPLAALCLVQLLRHAEGLPTEAGLFAESLAYSTLQAGPEFARWRSERAARGARADGEPAAGPAVREPAEGPAVQVRREGARLRITLARPERHNAFSVEMRDALAEALALAAADASVETIRLEGEGPSFCSGGDLDEFGRFPDPATAHAVRSTRSVARLLDACAARTEARVHGACIGAGAELPAFCARVVAAPDAFFQLPEVAMGLVPGAGGTASLPRRIGRQRTAWLALTGERVDAATALDLGLVDAVEG